MRGTMSNFVKIGQTFAAISRLYCFQVDGHRHLGFEKFNFLTADTPGRRSAYTCLILSRLANSLLRYGDFSIIRDGGYPPCWIFKIAILNILPHKECQCASPCELSWKSVKRLRKYCDFTAFQNGRRRHLGFSKIQILRPVRLRDQICVTVLNFVKIGQSIFLFSRWRPSAMLNFEKCDF